VSQPPDQLSISSARPKENTMREAGNYLSLVSQGGIEPTVWVEHENCERGFFIHKPLRTLLVYELINHSK
jgi:hypothetical protein